MSAHCKVGFFMKSLSNLNLLEVCQFPGVQDVYLQPVSETILMYLVMEVKFVK